MPPATHLPLVSPYAFRELDRDSLARMLTVREAARRLGVHQTTVRYWLATGKLSGIRVGWENPRARSHGGPGMRPVILIREEDVEGMEDKRKGMEEK